MRCGSPRRSAPREEDPFTDRIAAGFPVSVIVHRSRFEIDLNRRRDESVYLDRGRLGLDVWRRPPPDDVVERFRAEHDEFYAAVR